jgi:hypothetical protein
LDLAEEYLALVASHPAPLVCVTFHLRRICRAELTKYELLEPLLASRSVSGAGRVMARCRQLCEGRGEPFVPGGPAFVADPPEALAVEAALQAWPGMSQDQAVAAARRVAAEASSRKRRAWEERMVKRARQEGRADEAYYLKAGLAPPTEPEVARVRGMGREAQAEWWRANFGRHCRERYVDGRCPWELDRRGCGYLHPGEGVGGEATAVQAQEAEGEGMWCFGCG